MIFLSVIYFDNAATTSLREEVLKEMLPMYLIEYGNPSAMYSLGRNAKRKVEEAREKVAKYLGAKKNEIYFTSCGSESDNLAIKGVCYKNKSKKHIITSKIEHNAVLETCRELEKEGYDVTFLDVDKKGKINLSQLEEAIRKDTAIISIMFANNEIGTIQPIKQIGEIAHRHNVYFHTDAVQAMGNIKINVDEMNIDLLSMSAHKFHGPKGVGALYVREGVEFKKIQNGGHQEKNKRAGTENVAQIVGLAKALECSYMNFDEKIKRVKSMRDYCIEELRKNFSGLILNGDENDRLVGNINVSFPNTEGEELLYRLDEKGICASAGSACNTGSLEPSHVLVAIGLEKRYIGNSLRITLGDRNTKREIDYFIQTLKRIING